jgi:hypothetical protein
MLELKNIYRGTEIKFYDYFMSLRQGLIEDFFKNHPNFENMFVGQSGDQYPKLESWRGSMLKNTYYGSKKYKHQGNLDKNEKELATKFPTAYSILKKFGDNCDLVAYALLSPHSVIRRHTDVENRKNTFIHIHIPLIIPDGDVGLEVNGEEVYWNDLFAFNDQELHSAWNNTEENRLIFMVYLPRTLLDIPPGKLWDQELSSRETTYHYKSHIPEIEKKKPT